MPGIIINVRPIHSEISSSLTFFLISHAANNHPERVCNFGSTHDRSDGALAIHEK